MQPTMETKEFIAIVHRYDTLGETIDNAPAERNALEDGIKDAHKERKEIRQLAWWDANFYARSSRLRKKLEEESRDCREESFNK